MFKWLQKLLHAKPSETIGRDISLPIESIPAEEQKPILVRGEFWKNTAETRRELPKEQWAIRDPNIEDLIKSLARINRAEVRRAAVEGLGALGQAAAPAIPALINSAVDIDKTVREASLNALDAIDADWSTNGEVSKAVPGLLTALKSWSPDVSKAAFHVLGLIGLPALPHLADALMAWEETMDKVYIMQVLAQLGLDAERAVPGLIRALDSELLQTRIVAAETLAKIGPVAAPAIPTLIKHLSDSYSDGRHAMATCLASIGVEAEPAIPALLPLLADRQNKVREASANALEKIGAKAVPALLELIKTRDVQRLKAWAGSMKKFSQWYTQPKTEVVVADKDDVMGNLSWTAYDIMEDQASLEYAQEIAIHIIGNLGINPSEAVPTVIGALTDPNPNIKLTAIKALGKFGPQARNSIPRLSRMLLTNDEIIQKATVKALGSIDANWITDPVAVSTIGVLAGQLDAKNQNKKIADLAFALMGASAIPVLINMLESGDQVAQENAAKALSLIGTEAKSAIPALTKTSQNNNQKVRDEIARALAKIGR